jgi:hypothetical protein
MVPVSLMKNGDADFVRFAKQYAIDDDKRFHDPRIYPDPDYWTLGLQAIFLAFQVVYEIAQMVKMPLGRYLVENAMNLGMLVLGYGAIYMQIYVGTYAFSSKVVIMFAIFASMFKTFDYLRVVDSFCYIVTMIRSVLYDLRIFGLFFCIVILSFSNVLDCFGRNRSEEYRLVGPVSANVFATLRMSLGDFDFSLIEMQELYWMHVLFWTVWVFMVFFSSLVFLNFIIAEVGSSYARCAAKIE